MKRSIPLILVLSLLLALLVPSALAEGASSSQEQTVQENTAAASEEAEPNIPAEEDSEQEPLVLQGDTVVAVQNANAPQNSATALHFSQLRQVMEKYCPSILSAKAALGELKDTDTSALRTALTGLYTLQTNVNNALKNIPSVPSAQADGEAGADAASDLSAIYGGLKLSLGANSALLAAQIQSLETQLDSLDTTVETTQNSTNDGINQIIKGAESLYIAIVNMEASADGVQRTIDKLDRAAAILEKQQKLGMASSYDVETLKYQRSQAASGLETLKYNIKTQKITLEGMCGMAMNGVVAMDSLTPPTAEELSGVNYEKNLTLATGRNVDVLNAQARDNDDQYKAAVSSFASKFKIVCLAVPESSRLVNTAQESVDFQQRTFAIAEKKYSLGMVSHEAYLSAKDDLQSAKDDLFTAQLNLCTAYRNYVWAVQCGLV